VCATQFAYSLRNVLLNTVADAASGKLLYSTGIIIDNAYAFLRCAYNANELLLYSSRSFFTH
jgi:hypothetical protein